MFRIKQHISRLLSKLYLLVVICLYAENSSAQTNLVVNGDFESYINCPNSPYSMNEVTYWINADPSTNPDYFNTCNDTGFWSVLGVPQNAVGYQVPHSGNAYIGFFALNTGTPNQGREYIQTILIDTLVAGNKYLVSMYVNLANPMKYSIRTVGAYFTPTAITGSGGMLYAPTAQIVNPSINSLADTLNWVLIQDTLIANGGELYMTIGNFFYDNTCDTFAYNTSTTTYTFASYYYIDDVSVLDLSSIGVKENSASKEIVVYPNPAADQLIVKHTSTVQNNTELIIYNYLGESVLKQKINSLSDETLINTSELRQGVYLYKIYCDEILVRTERVIIIK